MTNEDKKIVADYMNWPEDEILVGYCTAPDKMAHFDLNDASLVAAEMQKRGEWVEFIEFADDYHFNGGICVEFSAWLMTIEDGQAKNFFGAFVEWRKTK